MILIAEPPFIFPIFIVVFLFILPVLIFVIISDAILIELNPSSGLTPEWASTPLTWIEKKSDAGPLITSLSGLVLSNTIPSFDLISL